MYFKILKLLLNFRVHVGALMKNLQEVFWQRVFYFRFLYADFYCIFAAPLKLNTYHILMQ